MKKSKETVPATVDWIELVANEPALDELLAEARRVRDDGTGYFCNHEAYAFGHQGGPSFKQRLHKLVGFGAVGKEGFMRSCEAWYLAMETITKALPRCRACCCVDEDGNFCT